MTDEQRAELLALAERVERLTGPCRETDAAIERVLHPEWEADDVAFDCPPEFTAGITAFETLVPGYAFPRMEYGFTDDAFGWAWRCQMLNSLRLPLGRDGASKADRPHGFVFALLAAALRARAAS